MLISFVACSDRAGNQLHRLIVEGHTYLEEKQAENEAEFHLSRYDHYDWHQDTGEIVFSSKGEAKVTASFQIIGDISKRSGTWMWAWANDTVDAPLKSAAKRVRELGQRQYIERLVKPTWAAYETDGWEMTGIAAKLVQAPGAYRTCHESGCEYLLLTKITWAKPTIRVRHDGDTTP